MIIPDCSVVVAWSLREQHSAYANEVLACVQEESALVPALWPAEVGNAFLMAERRKRIAREDQEEFLRLLADLPIDVDSGSGLAAVPVLWILGRECGLTAYDAAYLELALRTGGRLATLDAALLKAARRSGAKVFG